MTIHQTGRGRALAAAVVLCIVVVAPGASHAKTVQPVAEWFDPNLPLFAADALVDPNHEAVYVADQITARISKISLSADGSAVVIPGGGTIESLEGAGFSPTRGDVLAIVSRRAEFRTLLEGDIKLDWAAGRLRMFDGRRIFGGNRWIEMDPARPQSTAAVRDAPTLANDSARDPSLPAEAVAEMAGLGFRIRPLRWALRNDILSVIDVQGRAFVFLRDKSAAGRSRLRLLLQIDSLTSRLADFDDAELTSLSADQIDIRIGKEIWAATVSDDPYTGERAFAFNATKTGGSGGSARLADAAGKRKLQLPYQWTDFLRQPQILAEGPAGQLISCKIRLTNLGLKSLLILSESNRIRIVPWRSDDELRPEDIVTMPEGFAVPEPPMWRLIGWSAEFNGLISIGNSRFQRLAPILSEKSPGRDGGGRADMTGGSDTVIETSGFFALDAEQSILAEWPRLEWPRTTSFTSLHMNAEPMDLTVTQTGEVFVLARDAEHGLRLFQISEVPEPVLDIPDHMDPLFLPGGRPTILSRVERHQTTWIVAGQPPTLIRKETFDANWHAGQGIAWRDESAGFILFNTDPAGQSDTGVTIPIEGLHEVRQALIQSPDVWLLETDSGIVRLDARDPTEPDVSVIDPQGGELRVSPFGPLFTVPAAGTSEVFVVGPGGNKISLGRFNASWEAMGATLDRLFFKDRATDKILIVPRHAAGDDVAQVTGRLEFNYDDPSNVLLCAIGDEAYCMMVRPRTPTFLLGPMPYGSYMLDVSAGGFDLASPPVFSVTQPEIILPDVKLVKSLDFLYRRAVSYEESGNADMAKFNYDMYLSLSSDGGSADDARSAIVRFFADDSRWNDMIDFYQKTPAGTRWTADALRLVFDHLPRLAERLDIARKLMSQAARPDLGRLELLFFLYKYTLDPAYKSTAGEPGVPPVYAKFFESFDRFRK